MEVFDETDDEAPDTWTGGVPVFQCPNPAGIYCHLVYAQPMDLIWHMQEDHPVDVDLDPMPLSDIFGDSAQDVDLDTEGAHDVDLDTDWCRRG